MLRKPGLVVTSAVCGALVLGTAGPAAAADTGRNAAPPDTAAAAPGADTPQSSNGSGGLLGALSDVLHVVGDALKNDDKKSDAEKKAEAQAIADELSRLQGRDLMSAQEYPASQSGLTGTDAPADIYTKADPYAPTDHADADYRAPALPADRAPSPEMPQEQAIGLLHNKLLGLVSALGSDDREDLTTAAGETVSATTNLAKTILGGIQQPFGQDTPQQPPYAPGTAASTPDVDY
ncbi:hypothetical protein [Streptomyces sp. Ru73]|uniref:hypothetical protein n=1 Tax=Streptomyces sp. Ru73 TaxID=2080748 RepID=UPI0011B08314|nr:hypothetical protein [Streptomyces sp. Ru73]